MQNYDGQSHTNFLVSLCQCIHPKLKSRALKCIKHSISALIARHTLLCNRPHWSHPKSHLSSLKITLQGHEDLKCFWFWGNFFVVVGALQFVVILFVNMKKCVTMKNVWPWNVAINMHVLLISWHYHICVKREKYSVRIGLKNKRRGSEAEHIVPPTGITL